MNKSNLKSLHARLVFSIPPDIPCCSVAISVTVILLQEKNSKSRIHVLLASLLCSTRSWCDIVQMLIFIYGKLADSPFSTWHFLPPIPNAFSYMHKLLRLFLCPHLKQ